METFKSFFFFLNLKTNQPTKTPQHHNVYRVSTSLYEVRLILLKTEIWNQPSFPWVEV